MTILEAFHQIGVKAVRLTGGEPLLYPHIEELLGRINDTGSVSYTHLDVYKRQLQL